MTLQRCKCRDCGRTFNALTGTPLAKLRYRERWLDQTQALIDGLSNIKASQRLAVARSTAFRWRHRFLALSHHVKAGHFGGIVEADETCILKPCKGQPERRCKSSRKPRCRGGRATIRGMSQEHEVVTVSNIGLPPPQSRDRVLTPDELTAVLTGTGRDARLLRFCLASAFWVGEALQMTPDHVEDRVWTIPITKNGKPHEQWLTDFALAQVPFEASP